MSNNDETIQALVEYNSTKMENEQVEQNTNIDTEEHGNSDENGDGVVDTMEVGSGELVNNTQTSDGPKKRCEVAKYFSLVGNRATCMCKTPVGGICGMGLNFTTHNMKRHLKRRHSEVFTQLPSNNPSTTQPLASKRPTMIQATRPSMCVQPTISSMAHLSTSSKSKPHKNQQKIVRKKSKEELEEFVLSLIVHSGVPFNFFDNSYWEDYLDDEFSQLGVARDPVEIEKLTIAHYRKQQDKLIQVLKDQFIFLKIDSCKCRSSLRKYFAVNVQFFNRSAMKVECATLSVLQVDEHHTALQLNEMLEETLGHFSIKHEQILMVVSDNATVMVNAADRLGETDLDVDMSESGDDDPLMGEALELMFGITYMRCGARTLQLAIQDGLDKSSDCQHLLAQLRDSISEEEETTTSATNVKKETGSASWWTSYLMIERALQLKPTIDEFSEEQWEEVESIRQVLEEAYNVTKQLQEEQSLLPGKFFYQWKKLEFDLNKVDTPLAQSITQEMKQREFSLFKNEILLAAIYIDPQCRDLLSSYHQQEGRNHFINLAVHIKNANTDSAAEASTTNSQQRVNITPVDNHSDDPFEIVLDTTARERIQEHQQQNRRALFQYMSKVNDALTFLDMQDRSLTLFEAIKNYQAILHDSCLAASSIPTTQSGAHRLCTALKFFKSSKQFSLSELSSSSILFLKLNGLN